MKPYERVRGKKIMERCTKKIDIAGRITSAMYCDCGCQSPRTDDPIFDLRDVSVGKKIDEGYANVELLRAGRIVGSINTQYDYIIIEDVEYLGVDRDFIGTLWDAAIAVLNKCKNNNISAGTTLSPGVGHMSCPQEWAAGIEKKEKEIGGGK